LAEGEKRAAAFDLIDRSCDVTIFPLTPCTCTSRIPHMIAKSVSSDKYPRSSEMRLARKILVSEIQFQGFATSDGCIAEYVRISEGKATHLDNIRLERCSRQEKKRGTL